MRSLLSLASVFFTHFFLLVVSADAQLKWDSGESTSDGVSFVQMLPGSAQVESRAGLPVYGSSYITDGVYLFALTNTPVERRRPELLESELKETNIKPGTQLNLVFSKGEQEQIKLVALTADTSRPVTFEKLSDTAFRIKAVVGDVAPTSAGDVESAFGLIIVYEQSKRSLSDASLVASSLHYLDFAELKTDAAGLLDFEVAGLSAAQASLSAYIPLTRLFAFGVSQRAVQTCRAYVGDELVPTGSSANLGLSSDLGFEFVNSDNPANTVLRLNIAQADWSKKNVSIKCQPDISTPTATAGPVGTPSYSKTTASWDRPLGSVTAPVSGPVPREMEGNLRGTPSADEGENVASETASGSDVSAGSVTAKSRASGSGKVALMGAGGPVIKWELVAEGCSPTNGEWVVGGLRLGETVRVGGWLNGHILGPNFSSLSVGRDRVGDLFRIVPTTGPATFREFRAARNPEVIRVASQNLGWWSALQYCELVIWRRKRSNLVALPPVVNKDGTVSYGYSIASDTSPDWMGQNVKVSLNYAYISNGQRLLQRVAWRNLSDQPGFSERFSVKLPPAPAGATELVTLVDDLDAVSETTDGDNQATGPLPGPNIVALPPRFADNGDLLIGYRVENRPLPVSSPVKIHLVYSTSPSWSDRLTPDSQSVFHADMDSAVRGDQFIPVSRDKLSSPPSGARYLLAKVDRYELVTESTEDDNVAPLLLADLFILQAEYATGGVIKVVIQRNGDNISAKVPPTLQAFWATGKNRTDIIGNSIFSAAVTDGGRQTVTISALRTLLPPANATNILVIFDQEQTVPESNESNNHLLVRRQSAKLESFEKFSSQSNFDANVVGRDLASTGLGQFGHVGIWDGVEKRVLEVLKNKDVVNRWNTAAEFRNATTFWGIKMYWDNRQNSFDGRTVPDWPTLTERQKIKLVGRKQGGFDPAYTLTAKYRPGEYVTERVWNPKTKKWETVTKMITAIFRCDTFVAWAYGEGLRNNSAQLFVTPMTPKTLFARDALQLW